MCGISGHVTTETGADNYALLRKLNAGIEHRGPDDEGFFEAPAWTRHAASQHR